MSQYFANIWRGLATAVRGLATTFPHLTRRKVTRQYPEPKDQYILPDRARNRLYVNMDDCIGCDQCARACPVNCIEIDTVKQVPGEDLGLTSQGKKKALWVTRFDIDMAKCCFCSLCIWPCPTECIVMTEVFEYAETKREDLIYKFATMDTAEARLHEDNWKKWEVEASAQRARQAAERAAKGAPSTPSRADASTVKPPPFLRPAPPKADAGEQQGNPPSANSNSSAQGNPTDENEGGVTG